MDRRREPNTGDEEETTISSTLSITRRRTTRPERLNDNNTHKDVALLGPTTAMPSPSSPAVDLNVRLRSADMPAGMQERAFRCSRSLLHHHANKNDNNKKPNPTHLALSLKKEFDAQYGPAWHCIVGKSFGSFVTHSSGGFVYFSIENLSFLLFKTQVRPVKIAPKLP